MNRIEYSPITNGVDYINEVFYYLADHEIFFRDNSKRYEPSSRNLKYAVLHLHAAVEVLLKARLTREHWSLVYKDVSKADIDDFYAGNFISIGVEETLTRLEKIVGIKISKPEKDSFQRLNKIRNKLQHFGIDDSSSVIEELVCQVFDGILVFIKEHLQSNGKHPEEDKIIEKLEHNIRGEWARLQHLTDARFKRIEPLLKDIKQKKQCPRCKYPALVFKDVPKCLACEKIWLDDQNS